MRFLSCGFVLLMAFFLLPGCEESNPVKDRLNEELSDTTVVVSEAYAQDTVVVDYKEVNNVVYYDFSSGTKVSRPHDTWDIAFDTDRYIIANSGDYGSGVLVCSTGITDISQDFTGWKDSLDFGAEFGSFRFTTRESNSLGLNYKIGSGMGSTYTKNVYLIYTEDGSFYKMQVTGSLPMGAGLRLHIDSLSGDGAVEDTFETDGLYDYVYVDLGAKTTVDVAPKKADWDVRFGRTGDYIMSSLKSGRSSVAINTKAGVEVAAVSDAQLADVTDAANLSYSTDLLAIGHSWYDFNRDTRVYELAPVVYVFKTAEGNYAKMKMLSFKGPNDERFWSVIKYLYQEDGTTTFSD